MSKRLKALPSKLDIKKHTSSIHFIFGQASRFQHAFSKTCLVNLISKDTHLVFSISRQASICQRAFKKPCLLDLISKDTHLVFSLSQQPSQCQHEFSKPCLLNFISKDTHLVFSISRQPSRCQHAFSKPCLLNLISKDSHLHLRNLLTHTLLFWHCLENKNFELNNIWNKSEQCILVMHGYFQLKLTKSFLNIKV